MRIISVISRGPRTKVSIRVRIFEPRQTFEDFWSEILTFYDVGMEMMYMIIV